MIHFQQIQSFFPELIRNNPAHRRYMLKEYIQLMILDYLSTSPYVKKMTFIGGANLRLIKGIDRFSEYLDFDCKQLSKQEFMEMVDQTLSFLQRSGLRAETRDNENNKLKLFCKSIYFPELLFELGLSGYKEERFLIKIESQNQGVNYSPIMANIKGCGFFFPFPVPPDNILCAMKISALLSRQKGRDFYDVMFLLALTPPNYDYLIQKCDIYDWTELKDALIETLDKLDLEKKSHDFEHLLFRNTGDKILRFKDFIDKLN